MAIPRNPYLNRAMIRDPKAFFGRRREVGRLAARIGANPPQSTALIGDRRIGKSSLLHYISHTDVVKEYLDEPDRTLFVFLDFQEDQQPGVADFFCHLFHRLQTALGGRYEIRATPDYEGFRIVLEDLDRNGFKVILLLDEFERVVRNADFNAGFFSYLRALAGHQNIAYITSSNQDLQQLCHTQEITESLFFNIFTTLHLGPLGSEESRALIRDPSRDPPFSLAPHTEGILELSGCLPFFLQMACSAVFEILLEEGTCQWEQVRERFLEEARPHFHYYWNHFDAADRAICYDLACGQNLDPMRAEYQALVKRGFVTADGRLFSTLFTDFVREARDEQIDELERRVQERTRELEEANRQVQKATELKSQFLANMSHELRTPMNAIVGFTNLVLRRSGDILPERQRENLRKVTQSADHLLNLISDILDLSKIEAGRMDVQVERFDVVALVASCCAAVDPLRSPGVQLGYEALGEVGEANTDGKRLRQIVTNLLSNALKFTEEGKVVVRVAKEDEYLVIAVSDTGIGIPAEAQDTIFEEFRQVEGNPQAEQGSGLGLAITRGWTELLGGTIGVQSQVGQGATFTVQIPMVYRAPE